MMQEYLKIVREKKEGEQLDYLDIFQLVGSTFKY